MKMGKYSKLWAGLVPQLIPVLVGLIDPAMLQAIMVWLLPLATTISGLAIVGSPKNAD